VQYEGAKFFEKALTIIKWKEESLEGYNFKTLHTHNVSTPIPMMPTMIIEKPTNKLESMMGQLIKEMNQWNANLVQAQEPCPFKLRYSSSITCYICNKEGHYANDYVERGSTSWEDLSPKRRMSFEHEKVKTVNLIEQEFYKTKGAWNENVFPIETNLMVAKKGKVEKSLRKIPNTRKWRKWHKKKGNERIKDD
jgi:hypothetical protein